MKIISEIRKSILRTGTMLLLGLTFVMNSRVQAADYTITTTGGAVVITDVTGGSEALAVSQSGSNLRFVVTPTTRTYSINGGPDIAFTVPANIPLAGVNSITMNTATGNDVINIAAFTALLPDFMVNGGTGDDIVNFTGDITFAVNANLDVDLQNDDPSPGTDAINLSFGVDLIFSGTGAVVMKGSKNISFAANSTLRTVDGNLTLEANQQIIPTAGSFHGISALSNGLIETTGTGTLSVSGRGGDSGGANGVLLRFGSKIRGGTIGTMTVTGTGGASLSNQNWGVCIETSSEISSNGAHLSVIGQGGGIAGSDNNLGVRVIAGAKIAAGGAGNTTVIGTAGATTGFDNYGVIVSTTGATITSAGGNVNVTGLGAGTGVVAYGVLVAGTARISAGGSGTVTVTGTGSISGNGIGVNVDGGTSSITSGGGDVFIFGQGGNTLSGNYGVALTNFSTISAGGMGNVSVNGVGGLSSGNSNPGVLVSRAGTAIISSGGNVIVNGVGGGSGFSNSNPGVSLQDGGRISAVGLGIVTVTGTGGSSTANNNHGLRVTSSSQITTPNGNINVTGTRGINSIGAADILLDLSGSIFTTGPAATITLNSTTGGTWPHNTGTDVSNASATQTILFGSNSKLNIDIDGTVVNSSYQQLNVAGLLDLNNAILTFTGSTHVPSIGQSFTIVNNDGIDPVIGAFNGLPEGSVISSFLGSVRSATISYAGGTGNDVVLTVIACVAPAFTTCPDPTPSEPFAVSAGAGCSAIVNYSPVVAGTAPITYAYTFTGATSGSGAGTGSGSAFNTGNTTVTVFATNACGTTSCSFVVRVKDATAPVISSVPGPAMINCPSVPSFASPAASDNCGVTSFSFADVTTPGSCAGNYSVTRTWTASDAAGNTATASQTIHVQDITPPVVVCNNFSVTLDATGNASITAGDITSSVSDNCGTATTSASPLAFNCSNIGNNNVVLTATDACGNSGSCNAVVTVNCVAPTVSVSASATILYFYGGAVHNASGAVVSSIVLTGTVTGHCAPYDLSWTGPGTAGTTSTITVPAPATPGSYLYELTARKGTSCPATAGTMVCVMDASGGTTNKVTIAHGSGGGCNTLSVGIASLAAHLAHGDWIGTCAGGSTPSCVTPRLAHPVAGAATLDAAPNPFYASTKLSFTVTDDAQTTLTVYDLTGKTIATLFAGDVIAGQVYSVDFSAADNLSAGMYIVRLESDQGEMLTRKIILSR